MGTEVERHSCSEGGVPHGGACQNERQHTEGPDPTMCPPTCCSQPWTCTPNRSVTQGPWEQPRCSFINLPCLAHTQRGLGTAGKGASNVAEK